MSSRPFRAYVCLVITFTAAFLAVSLRLLARRLTKLPFWLDDYLAIFAFLWAVSFSGVDFWLLQIGMGKKLADIPQDSEVVLEKGRMIFFWAQITYSTSLAFSKLAILAFYWRVFGTSNIKLPIKVLSAAAIIWLIIRTFMTIFHCIPVQGFWDKNIGAKCTIDDGKYFMGTIITHMFLDVFILALPVMQIAPLKLPKAQKIAVGAMFMFGIFVCIMSIIIVVYASQLDSKSPEMLWNWAPDMMWSVAEVNLTIVSACLPLLRPVYLYIRRRNPLSDGSGSSNRTYRRHSTHGSKSHRTALASAALTNHKNIESDSTHQLADLGQREDSIGGDSIADCYDSNGQTSRNGHMAVITGKDHSASYLDSLAANGWGGKGGIVVTNEVGIKVSKVQKS
ncbi:hypothetical protein P154DRAFT_624133 [Amniculicola lignicola CBS 123094]|uniref:Rhodopsin domain-containing protein n=1 Tax=Amniculicola lignicola CBS 123094 TaxID=1392246 RepID=A0A6A5W2P7_9PLEO|nr:hypothetical protein P154DRAFT_624133 [Amniculicola lignicola CBS 123094]